MKPQTSWRMLAISAAVAVMLTACGGGSDGGNGANGANGNNGANVTGNGDGTNPGTNPAATKPAVGARINRNSNTVTVELVDADGNVVPVPASGPVPQVTIGGKPVTPTVTPEGKLELELPSGENGFDYVVTDDTGATIASGSVPGARFKPNPNGGVDVVLVDASGTPLTSGPDQAQVNSPITSDTTVGLVTGSGSVTVDPNAPAGAQPFTLTDPNGNTFTGTVDTGSLTDANGYYLLGCSSNSNSKSPDFPASDWASVWDGSTQVTTTDLEAGKTYTFKFKLNYKDSAGNSLPTGVTRDVQVRLQAGKGTIDGVDMDALVGNDGTNQSAPPDTSISMKDGAGEFDFVPKENTANPAQGQPGGFMLGVRDGACADAGRGWGDLRLKYETNNPPYNVVTTKP